MSTVTSGAFRGRKTTGILFHRPLSSLRVSRDPNHFDLARTVEIGPMPLEDAIQQALLLMHGMSSDYFGFTFCDTYDGEIVLEDGTTFQVKDKVCDSGIYFVNPREVDETTRTVITQNYYEMDYDSGKDHAIYTTDATGTSVQVLTTA